MFWKVCRPSHSGIGHVPRRIFAWRTARPVRPPHRLVESGTAFDAWYAGNASRHASGERLANSAYFRPTNSQNDAAQRIRPQRRRVEQPSRTPMPMARILVVEDEKAIRNVLRNILLNENSAHLVDEAEDGLKPLRAWGSYLRPCPLRYQDAPEGRTGSAGLCHGALRGHAVCDDFGPR